MFLIFSTTGLHLHMQLLLNLLGIARITCLLLESKDYRLRINRNLLSCFRSPPYDRNGLTFEEL